MMGIQSHATATPQSLWGMVNSTLLKQCPRDIVGQGWQCGKHGSNP